MAGRITCQLLKVHGTNDVRHTEMHAAEPLVHVPSFPEAEKI
jgi:hypothetical protein